jgi:hypothetical protein
MFSAKLWAKSGIQGLLYKLSNINAQSICTHYSSLSGQPDIFLGSGTLKKKIQNMGCKKQGAKKQGHCYSKREETAWPLLVFE